MSKFIAHTRYIALYIQDLIQGKDEFINDMVFHYDDLADDFYLKGEPSITYNRNIVAEDPAFIVFKVRYHKDTQYVERVPNNTLLKAKDQVKLYLGCDLFTEGQRWQALKIEEALKQRYGNRVSIYNPANNLDINDKEAGFASGKQILLADYERLKESDALIALMDTQDLGLASEMGIAWEQGKPIFQLYTDIRLGGADKQDKIEAMQQDIFQNDFQYINKLVTGLSYVNVNNEEHTPTIYKTSEALIDGLVDYIYDELDSDYRFDILLEEPEDDSQQDI